MQQANLFDPFSNLTDRPSSSASASATSAFRASSVPSQPPGPLVSDPAWFPFGEKNLSYFLFC
jgi:hypothetical protein